MLTTRVSSKGQIILPKSIRDARGWGPATKIVVENGPAGVLLRPALRPPATTLAEVAGCLKPKHKSSLSAARIETAIQREVKERRARGRY
jgi:AbrB family looped-hinge helix DNA binding protein